MFNCTSDAVPPAKYRFLRMDASGQSVVSSSNSETKGILVVASIMHTLSVYNVTYKCIPYNLLGNGPEKTMMVDIQGVYFKFFYSIPFQSKSSCTFLCLIIFHFGGVFVDAPFRVLPIFHMLVVFILNCFHLLALPGM